MQSEATIPGPIDEEMGGGGPRKMVWNKAGVSSPQIDKVNARWKEMKAWKLVLWTPFHARTAQPFPF